MCIQQLSSSKLYKPLLGGSWRQHWESESTGNNITWEYNVTSCKLNFHNTFVSLVCFEFFSKFLYVLEFRITIVFTQLVHISLKSQLMPASWYGIFSLCWRHSLLSAVFYVIYNGIHLFDIMFPMSGLDEK